MSAVRPWEAPSNGKTMSDAEWLLHNLYQYQNGTDLIGLQRVIGHMEDLVTEEQKQADKQEEEIEPMDDQEEWYPRETLERAEQEWPPVPTAESLSYFFLEAVKSGKYVDPAKLRRVIDTAAYCLEAVPADVAENVLWYLSAGKADPKTWNGTFNKLAAVLYRPPVSAHEARRAMLEMMSAARAA